MEYEKLLKRARENLPESVKTSERFEIPKVRGHVEGNKTMISNFSQIASTLRRDPKHLLKFILKELATPGGVKGNFVVIGAKMPASRINEKIYQYARQFVLCSECGKPDTKIVKDKGIEYIKCMACGSKNRVKQ